MKIMIKVSLGIVHSIRKDGIIDGIKVSPAYPGTTDENLEPWFVTDVQPALVQYTMAMLNDSGTIQSCHIVPE